MRFTIDGHHVIFYIVLLIAAFAMLGMIHEWRMDVQKAELTTAADNREIAETHQRIEERNKQYAALSELLDKLRVTPKTPAPLRITRLEGLLPSMSVLPDQLVEPGGDLTLHPEQQVILINRLIDCRECEAEREKLKADLVDQQSATLARTAEVEAWKTAAKGGSLWRRTKRRAWHFVEDAIIIEAARAAAGHP